jgi:hypothetical protein
MSEHKEFVADDNAYTTAREKNKRLLQVINDDYLDDDIVLIERIEIAAQGWRITYRT